MKAFPKTEVVEADCYVIINDVPEERERIVRALLEKKYTLAVYWSVEKYKKEVYWDCFFIRPKIEPTIQLIRQYALSIVCGNYRVVTINQIPDYTE